jgi:hypothetical protein
MLLNDQWVIEEISKKIKKFPEVNENENTTCEPVGHSKGSLKVRVYSHEYIY